MVSRTYEVGGHRFGIRTDSHEFCGWLDRTLRRYRVAGSEYPRFSVVVAGAKGERSGKQFHILYKQTMAVVRTMDITTLGRALLEEIEAINFRERDDAIYAEAAVLASNGTRALVPGRLTPFLGRLGRRQIERSGISLPGTMYVTVDPGSGQVVPAPQTLKIPQDALERLSEIAPTNAAPDRFFLQEPSRADVVFWIDNMTQEPFHPVSRGFVLGRLWTWTLNGPRLGKAAVQGLTRLVEPTRCYGIPITESRDMLQNIADAIRSG